MQQFSYVRVFLKQYKYHIYLAQFSYNPFNKILEDLIHILVKITSLQDLVQDLTLDFKGRVHYIFTSLFGMPKREDF